VSLPFLLLIQFHVTVYEHEYRASFAIY